MSPQLDLDSILAFTIKLAQDVSHRLCLPAPPRWDGPNDSPGANELRRAR